jgi:hypothetical protein
MEYTVLGLLVGYKKVTKPLTQPVVLLGDSRRKKAWYCKPIVSLATAVSYLARLITQYFANHYHFHYVSQCRTLPSHQTYTHTPKPNKPVDPQLATSQQLQLHATHTKNC